MIEKLLIITVVCMAGWPFFAAISDWETGAVGAAGVWLVNVIFHCLLQND